MRLAVVGHIEWVDFVRVDRVPVAGEIAHASAGFAEPAGGGGVAAVQLARLDGEAGLFTALGDDELSGRSVDRLDALGVRVRAAERDEPNRRAVTFLDASGERTITTIGKRLQAEGSDALGWDDLVGADGVYFTAGDADALRAARAARVLVATPRAGAVLGDAGVKLDALVFSEGDSVEAAQAEQLSPPPALAVATRGAAGGVYKARDGSTAGWEAAQVPGPVADSYGCGDSFAAALTYGFAAGKDASAAVALAARAGAVCLTGHGPYERQLTRADLT